MNEKRSHSAPRLHPLANALLRDCKSVPSVDGLPRPYLNVERRRLDQPVQQVFDVLGTTGVGLAAEEGVFAAPEGGPIRRNRFGEVWRVARTAAKLSEGGTFHDLRHFYASLLIRHGESVKVVQRRGARISVCGTRSYRYEPGGGWHHHGGPRSHH